jgi:cyclopropane-fatty-acyl-phospholipid synthase
MSIARRTRAVSRLASVRLAQRAGLEVVRRALTAMRGGRIEIIGDARVVPGGRIAGGDTEAARDEPGITVRVNDPAFFAAVAFGGSCGAGEAYIDGMYTCTDLPAMIELVVRNQDALRAVDSGWSRLFAPISRVRYLLERNTRSGSQRNIRAHYDLSNEFFATFLDESMTYSSGIFDRPGMSLHEAQLAKIDRACRVLELGPGDHLLEIGTGWGSLAIHAARAYGCRVTTTTISREQHALASARVREAGLAARVEVVLTDYRDLSGQHDKLVSIEMIEAVGRENFDAFFGTCSRLLRPHGSMVLQAITIRDHLFEAAARRRDFLKKHVFPGSCLTSHASMLASVARATDLALVHSEDLGPHYCTTLAHWRRRTLDAQDQILAMGFDERFLRLWEFYLAYCEGVFASRRCSVSQLVFDKPSVRRAPSIERSAATGIWPARSWARQAEPQGSAAEADS